MMKKLLSCALAACMLMSFTTTAFAESGGWSDGEYTYISDGETADCELEYFQNSHYVVNIPLQISDVVYSNYQFTATEMNILDSEQVTVYLNGGDAVTMTNENGNKFDLYLYSSYGDGVVAHFNSHTLDSSCNLQARINDPMVYAGSYTGTATFRVALEQKQ